MKIVFDPASSTEYPQGHWYAATDNGNHYANGHTPINAIAELAIVLEKELLNGTQP